LADIATSLKLFHILSDGISKLLPQCCFLLISTQFSDQLIYIDLCTFFRLGCKSCDRNLFF